MLLLRPAATFEARFSLIERHGFSFLRLLSSDFDLVQKNEAFDRILDGSALRQFLNGADDFQ
ncbi:MAG: hypothetical protein BRD54_06435 [Bacteroidetes bacterium SW_8_64_56]|nr:MAG: hypothetical protein BRD54_06435 [Bacteroidetes bacterium SW_8_64_56]